MSRGYAAALNGPMFGICRGSPSSYEGATCNTLDFLHYRKSMGAMAPSAGQREGITLSIVRDWMSVRAVMGDSMYPDAQMAVQLYPSLLENGRSVTNPNLNTEQIWRSGIGVDRNGNVILMAGIGSMSSFAQQMAALGAVSAGYTDGGGSTSIGWKRSGRTNRQGSPEDRPVGSWIVINRIGYLPKAALVAGMAGIVYAGRWASKQKRFKKYLP